MDLLLRRARSDESAAISALMLRTIAASNSVDYPPDVIAHLFARHQVADVALMLATRSVFVATFDDAIVGTGALEADQLRGMFVEAGHQGLGVGAQLVAEVEAHGVARGLRDIWLQSSITAYGFYQRLGYEALRFVERDDGSVHIMRKALPASKDMVPTAISR